MAGLSNTIENDLLAHLVGKTAWTMPSSVYVALFTTIPADDGTGGVEVTGGAYARVLTSGATWTTPSAGAITTAALITFPIATAGWGTVTSVGLYTASSGGTLLAFGSLTSSVTVLSGQAPSFAIGDLDLTAD